jgi:hypothetical protein
MLRLEVVNKQVLLAPQCCRIYMKFLGSENGMEREIRGAMGLEDEGTYF